VATSNSVARHREHGGRSVRLVLRWSDTTTPPLSEPTLCPLLSNASAATLLLPRCWKITILPYDTTNMWRFTGVGTWPIRRLLQGSAFAPQEIQVLSDAFDAALQKLRLVDRSDPAVELVAKRIIHLASRGERDPVRLREGAVKGT